MKTDWVGVVANAASGRGRGRARVGRLVSCLDRMGLATVVAWTPEERAALVAASTMILRAGAWSPPAATARSRR